MSELEQTRNEFLQLRDRTQSVQLATLNANSEPEASYAPCIWYQNDCYLFLSGLSSHTGNLLRNKSISLLLLDENAASANAFARKRASLHGRAETVARDDSLFACVMEQFGNSFGNVMQLIEPLPDFRLFRVKTSGGSYVRGFGQAYEIVEGDSNQLRPVDPRQ